MYRIAICDSKQTQAEELKKQLYEIAAEIELECSIDVFRNFKQLYAENQNNPYQLICTEIIISGGNGLDFARRLRFQGSDAEIIFVTDEAEYALAAYSVFPIGYIIKPSTKKKLRDVFLRACEKQFKRATLRLRTTDGGSVSLPIDDILYIEVFRTEIDFHCKSRVVACSGSLVSVFELLPKDRFYRSHRSFIVNLAYVNKISRYSFDLVTGDRVAVAKNRYLEAKDAFLKYSGS